MGVYLGGMWDLTVLGFGVGGGGGCAGTADQREEKDQKGPSQELADLWATGTSQARIRGPVSLRRLEATLPGLLVFCCLRHLH